MHFQFIYNIRQQRANSVSRTKEVVALILELDPKFWNAGYNRAEEPKLQALLRSSREPNQPIATLPPLLFPKVVIPGKPKPFYNEAIPKVVFLSAIQASFSHLVFNKGP
jgi:hypothetical protein